MTAELRGVLDGLHGPQKPLWYRLGAALLHVRDAGKTKAPHRRFSALWFALEALFDNLDIDEDASVGSAGGRVSARVAALQPPDDWMGAMTYEQVRAFHADLAFGLYKLRNLAVHEGDLTPAVDDVAADQLEQLALLAVHTVLANARSGHLRRVEEVIAHCIYITPSNSLAKRPPES